MFNPELSVLFIFQRDDHGRPEKVSWRSKMLGDWDGASQDAWRLIHADSCQ
jgi:hypothetical protein